MRYFPIYVESAPLPYDIQKYISASFQTLQRLSSSPQFFESSSPTDEGFNAAKHHVYLHVSAFSAT